MIEHQPHGDILEIRLARPPVNALDREILDQLVEAVQAAPAQGAHGIILSGGEKVFSGGLDVPFLMTLGRDDLLACWSRFFDAARAIAKSPVPVAAAITGHAPAGGCVLALCCDRRVMSRSADPAKPYRIGLNETQVGLAVPDAIQFLLRRAVGARVAESLVVPGTMVDSGQALALGLVDELATDAGDAVERACGWLQSLTTLPWTPLLATRRIARADIAAALDAFGEAELGSFIEGWYSADTQAALQALMARLKK